MTAARTFDPSIWRPARILQRTVETPRAVTLRLAAEGWPGHLAGQRVDVRLTAEDGYQAVRSYSIAAAPSDGALDLTVEAVGDGEVSPYLVEVAEPGDVLEVRGPIGGWFTWRPADGGPLRLIAGGSGLVPLRSMVREAVQRAPGIDIRLLVSTRSPADLLYAAELQELAAAGRVTLLHTLTRSWPPGWTGRTGRIDAALVDEFLAGADGDVPLFVCGPGGFVEAASGLLLAAGIDAERIRTERFGPSGSA